MTSTQPWRIGKTFIGVRLRDLPTSYLLWCASAAGMRHKYPDATRLALAELRDRFADPQRFAALCVELRQDQPPPKYWRGERNPLAAVDAGEAYRLGLDLV